MSEKSIVEIVTEWDIVTARQQGRNEAKAIGFTTVDQARIATAISELAKNIYLYASEGDIIIERIEVNNKKGIAVTAVDQGPGIPNLQSVLEDSFPNSGSSSVGIPAVKRLMDKFEIESEVGKGTRVRIEKWL